MDRSTKSTASAAAQAATAGLGMDTGTDSDGAKLESDRAGPHPVTFPDIGRHSSCRISHHKRDEHGLARNRKQHLFHAEADAAVPQTGLHGDADNGGPGSRRHQ